MIGRKRKKAAQAAQTEADEQEAAAQDGGDAAPEESGDLSGQQDLSDRSGGPFDITEVEQPDAAAAARLDLGSLQLPMTEGIEVRLQMDEEAGEPVGLLVARGEGAVQVHVTAAPKSGGGWRETRTQIRGSLASDGATVDEVHGPFGTELVATMQVSDEAGRRVMQRLRFIGVDGPRWMLQATLYGAGAIAEQAAPLEEVFRSLVVVRGEQAMPPNTPLPLTMPQQVPEHIEAVAGDE